MNLKFFTFKKSILWQIFNKNISVQLLSFVFQMESDSLKKLPVVDSKLSLLFLLLIKDKDILLIVSNTGKEWLNLLKIIFLRNFTNFILFKKTKHLKVGKFSIKKFFVSFLKFKTLMFSTKFYKIFIVLYFLFLLLKKVQNIFQI